MYVSMATTFAHAHVLVMNILSKTHHQKVYIVQKGQSVEQKRRVSLVADAGQEIIVVHHYPDSLMIHCKYHY